MKKLALIVGFLALPLVSFAQDPQLTNVKGIATSIGEIVDILIPIVFALGLLVFFWGLVKYIFGAEHDKEQAKKTMLWGIVALFVMASVWGLVRFLGDTVGIDDNSNIDVPGIN